MVEQYSQKLIVVRHAEPDRVTGHLTENGKSQAKTFAYRLGVIAPESTQLLTGNAYRLEETANIIGSILKISVDRLARLSTTSSTRNMLKPSPTYDEEATLKQVLSKILPITTLVIIIAHSEMMNDLPYVHARGILTNKNFNNMTGYAIYPDGRYNLIS